MWKSFCNWLLYKKMGWTSEITEAHPDKYIICLAPHTSNWDFLIGQLYNGATGMSSNFLMKKEWFFWPLGPIFRKLGGIPVWRSKHTSMTDNCPFCFTESIMSNDVLNVPRPSSPMATSTNRCAKSNCILASSRARSPKTLR